MSRHPGKPYEHQEYPKMVDGVICQDADEEAALAQIDAAAEKPAAKKPAAKKAADTDAGADGNGDS